MIIKLYVFLLINLAFALSANANQSEVMITKTDICEANQSLSDRALGLYETELNKLCAQEEIAAKKYLDSKSEMDKLLKQLKIAGTKNIFYKPTTNSEYISWAENHFEKKFDSDTICLAAGFKDYRSNDDLSYIKNENLTEIIAKSAHSLVINKHEKFIKSFFKLLPYCFYGIEIKEVRDDNGRKYFSENIVPINVDRAEARAAIEKIINSVKVEISGEFSNKLTNFDRELKNNYDELRKVYKNISILKGSILETEEAFAKGYNTRADWLQAKQWGVKSLDEFNIFKMAQEFGVNRSIMSKIYELQINSNEKYIETTKELHSINYSQSTAPSGDEVLQFLLDKREAINKGMKIMDYKNQRIALLAKEKEERELRQNKIREAQIQREKADRMNYEKEYPYEAVVDCEWNGKSVRDLRLCLIGDNNSSTEIYVNNNGVDPKIYNFSTISSITRENQGVAKIPLRSRFELRAQNADNVRTMTVSIFDTKSGALLRKEALGFRRSVNFRN